MPLGDLLPTMLGVLIGAGAVLAWRRRPRRSAARGPSWQDEAIDALDIGLLLFDADGRLQRWSGDFARIDPELAGGLQVGRRFEDLLRRVVAQGGVPQAAGREEAWIAERLARHQQGGIEFLRQHAGGRWRRITERRLADGSLLSYSTDVTELVEVQRAAERAAARLADAIEVLPAGFELFDAEDRLVLGNARLADGYPQVAELLRQRPSFEALVRANAAAGALDLGGTTVDEWLDRRQSQRRALPSVSLHRTGGRWMRVYEHRTREGGVVGARVDVTEEIEQRAAAEQASSRLREAIEALPDGFALYDADDRLVLCNAKYRELYAASAAAIRTGARFEDLLRMGLANGQYPQATGREEAWLAERLAAHRHPGPPLLQALPDNRWLRIDERRTADGGIAGVRSDVTELVRREQALQALNGELDRANERMAQLSMTDSLTGIANRRVFDDTLREEWARATRHGGPLSLLLCDIDHFKRFNDHHGHPAGDACLRRVAKLLQTCTRRPTDLVARYGGEEFVLLLPYTDAAGAQAHARTCLAAVVDAAIPHGDSPVAPVVTLSIGASTIVRSGPDVDAPSLLARADLALYEAKRSGRHRVCVS